MTTVSVGYGKNVTKLILRFVAREAIPPGKGMGAAVEFFKDAGHRKRVLESAESKAIAAIQLIKDAPDNPYGNDSEVIAGMLLEKIGKRLQDERKFVV